MKIYNQYNCISNNFCFASSVQSKPTDKAKQKKVYAYAAGLGVLAAGGGIAAYKILPDKYIVQLAKDLSVELKEKIKPSNLKSVMSKKEFLAEIKKLNEQNYIASPENIKKGIFRADLHSHSNFSDGVLSVEEILNQAADYGDKLYNINKKKFIFAISDHDGVGGVKEALKIIAKNPQKYKNIKFVPAAELSFPIKCHQDSEKFSRCGNDVEMAELLIYNINPFSSNVKEYCETLYKKRISGIKDALILANLELPGYNFSADELRKFWELGRERPWGMNQHWGVYHYLNMKTRITDIAKAKNKNPEVFFDEILTYLLEKKMDKNGHSLDKYFADNNLKTTVIGSDKRIDDFKKKICPRVVGSLLYAPNESSITEISNLAKKENAILAFAHPGFTMQNMNPKTMKDDMEYLIKNTYNLKCSETFHQAYPLDNITRDEIQRYNKILAELDLIHIGGRDNHKKDFTNFEFEK